MPFFRRHEQYQRETRRRSESPIDTAGETYSLDSNDKIRVGPVGALAVILGVNRRSSMRFYNTKMLRRMIK